MTPPSVERKPEWSWIIEIAFHFCGRADSLPPVYAVKAGSAVIRVNSANTYILRSGSNRYLIAFFDYSVKTLTNSHITIS